MLSVYNGRVYIDENPWSPIYIQDLNTQVLYEIILINDKIGTQTTTELPNNYQMFDLLQSLTYEFFIEDGLLGIIVVDDIYNIGDGYYQNYVKVGTKFYLNINSNLSGQINRLKLSVINDKTNDILTNTYTFTELNTIYKTDMRILQEGSYSIVLNIQGFGTKITSVNVIDRTILDLNNRIPLLTDQMIKLNGKYYI